MRLLLRPPPRTVWRVILNAYSDGFAPLAHLVVVLAWINLRKCFAPILLRSQQFCNDRHESFAQTGKAFIDLSIDFQTNLNDLGATFLSNGLRVHLRSLA